MPRSISRERIIDVLIVSCLAEVPLIWALFRASSTLPSAVDMISVALALNAITLVFIFIGKIIHGPGLSVVIAYVIGIFSAILSGIFFALVFGTHIGIEIGVWSYAVAIITGMIFAIILEYAFLVISYELPPTLAWKTNRKIVEELIKKDEKISAKSLGWCDSKLNNYIARKLAEATSKTRK